MTPSTSRRGSRAPSAFSGPLSTVRYDVNGVRFDMVRVPSGRFIDGEGSARRELLVSRPFEIGVAPVTQALWRAVMGSSPSKFRGEDQPVEQVSWDDVRELMGALAARGFSGFRLPTEAEWAWAARCGAPTRWAGAYRAKVVAVANASQTESVAGLSSSVVGAFDFSGNVFEWVDDWHRQVPPAGVDVQGPASGSNRVYRGGQLGQRLADRAGRPPQLRRPRLPRRRPRRAAPQDRPMIPSTSRRGPRSSSTFSGPLSTVQYDVNGVRFDMVRVPPGRFIDGEGSAKRELLVSRPFEIGIVPVTQALWRAVMGSSPSDFRGQDRPVEKVSWDDVRQLMGALAQQGLPGFRLPTEAQWAWAARCGAPTWWAGANRPGVVAVVESHQTAPVASLSGAAVGAFDLSGNVFERVGDRYALEPPAGVDVRGPASGSFLFFRGGGWFGVSQSARVANREYGPQAAAPASSVFGSSGPPDDPLNLPPQLQGPVGSLRPALDRPVRRQRRPFRHGPRATGPLH